LSNLLKTPFFPIIKFPSKSNTSLTQVNDQYNYQRLLPMLVDSNQSVTMNY
jgi:hypothetical protein